MLVLAGLPWHSGDGDELDGLAHLLRPDAEVIGSILHADALVLHQEWHERKQEGELVLGMQRYLALSHSTSPHRCCHGVLPPF